MVLSYWTFSNFIFNFLYLLKFNSGGYLFAIFISKFFKIAEESCKFEEDGFSDANCNCIPQMED